MMLRSAHAQHVGKVRTNQEDAFLDVPYLYAVADGMGGHADGEIASSLAIDALRNGLTSTPFDMQRTFMAAHARVLAAGNGGYHGPGTTMTAIAFSTRGYAIVGHVGDSRLYRIRDGRGDQITKDHENEWGALTNCIGVSPDSFQGANIFEIDVRSGDLFVIATDGLTDYFDAGAVGAIAAGPGGHPQIVADALVRHALEAGGKDNVTVVVVEVVL